MWCGAVEGISPERLANEKIAQKTLSPERLANENIATKNTKSGALGERTKLQKTLSPEHLASEKK